MAIQKTIKWEDFDKLCAIQCTGEEIAAFFHIDYDTLNAICRREQGKSFSDYFAQKRQSGKISLRLRQFQAAQEGNPTMMVWLGKNWLGQQDNQIIETSVSIKGFRVVEDDTRDDSEQAAS